MVLAEPDDDRIDESDRDAAARQTGRRLAAIASVLYTRLKHLHGLTKTSTRKVRAAALIWPLRRLLGRSFNGQPALWLEDEGIRLSPWQMQIVRAAVQFDCGDVDLLPRPLSPPGNKKEAVRGLAARIAALLTVAEGLDDLAGPEGQIVAVIDDGNQVAIGVSSPPEDQDDRLADPANIRLWNQLALRPIGALYAVRCSGARGTAGVETSPDEPLAEVGRRILQRHLEQLIARQYGLANADDAEYVHEMRVAIRRLRAAIKVFRKAFVGKLDDEAQQLRQMADALGVVRDADVFIDFLGNCQKKGPKTSRWLLGDLLRCEKRHRRQMNGKLLEICRSNVHRHFLADFYQRLCEPVGSVTGLQPTRKGASRPVAEQARRALDARLADVAQFGRRLGDLSPIQQHELRIACKKFRYTAEFFCEFYPPELRSSIDTMTRLQDLLGSSHDADVYIERLNGYFKKHFVQAGKKSRARAETALVALRRHLKRLKRRDLEKAQSLWKSCLSPRRRRDLGKFLTSPRTA